MDIPSSQHDPLQPERPLAAAWLHSRTRSFATVAALGVTVATIAAFAGRAWWAFDLASHFRVHYLLAALVLAAALLGTRATRRGMACLLVALVNALVVAPALMPAPRTAHADSTAPTASLRIAMVNVNTANPHRDLVRRFIDGADADVVVLLEINDTWIGDLAPALDAYPHAVVRSRLGNFGLSVHSRVPLEDAGVVVLGAAGVPSIVATVVHDGARVELLATHPVPPVGPTSTRLRDDQLGAVAAFVRDRSARTGAPAVVVGDLNVTRWSHAFRLVLDGADLTPAAGVAPTWPSRLGPLGIQIDHFLVGGGIGVDDHTVGPGVGSDHRPIVVDLRIPVTP